MLVFPGLGIPFPKPKQIQWFKRIPLTLSGASHTRSRLIAPFGNWSNRSLPYLGRTVDLCNVYMIYYIFFSYYDIHGMSRYIHKYIYILYTQLHLYGDFWIDTVWKCVFTEFYYSHLSITNWDDFWELLLTILSKTELFPWDAENTSQEVYCDQSTNSFVISPSEVMVESMRPTMV